VLGVFGGGFFGGVFWVVGGFFFVVFVFWFWVFFLGVLVLVFFFVGLGVFLGGVVLGGCLGCFFLWGGCWGGGGVCGFFGGFSLSTLSRSDSSVS